MRMCRHFLDPRTSHLVGMRPADHGIQLSNRVRIAGEAANEQSREDAEKRKLRRLQALSDEANEQETRAAFERMERIDMEQQVEARIAESTEIASAETVDDQ